MPCISPSIIRNILLSLGTLKQQTVTGGYEAVVIAIIAGCY